jgi:hypothetical protein
MIIDLDSFTDLGMTLKAQADVLLLMAKHLAMDAEGSQTLRHFVTEMHVHMAVMEGILRAVREENHLSTPSSSNSGRA